MREGLVALVVLVACGDAAPAPAPDAPVAVDAEPDARLDPLCTAGRFRLIGLACQVGGTWRSQDALVAAATASELVLEPRPRGCRLRYRWASAGCAEEQVFDAESLPDGRLRLTTDGIARCEPAGCSLTPSDDACAPGARAGAARALLAVVLDEGDLIVSLDDGAVGACAALGATAEEQTWDPSF